MFRSFVKQEEETLSYMNHTSNSLIKVLAKPSYFRNKVATCSNYQLQHFLNNKNNPLTNALLIRHTSTTKTQKNTFSLSDTGISGFEKIGQKLDLTFNDSKTAYQAKSNFELIRGYLVFQLCGLKFLLQNQKMVSFYKTFFLSFIISIINHLF